MDHAKTIEEGVDCSFAKHNTKVNGFTLRVMIQAAPQHRQQNAAIGKMMGVCRRFGVKRTEVSVATWSPLSFTWDGLERAMLLAAWNDGKWDVVDTIVAHTTQNKCDGGQIKRLLA